jgi:hypothetical protein
VGGQVEILECRWEGNDKESDQVQCCTPVIPALKRLRQEGLKFKASLGYIVRTFSKKQNKTPK